MCVMVGALFKVCEVLKQCCLTCVIMPQEDKSAVVLVVSSTP